MKKEKTDFNKGFDQGFNYGFDLGYDKGFEFAQSRFATLSKPCIENFSVINHFLHPHLIINTTREQFITLFSDFLKDVTHQDEPANHVLSLINLHEKENKHLALISISNLLHNRQSNNYEIDPLIKKVLSSADIIIRPSISNINAMFFANSLINNNKINKPSVAPFFIKTLFTSDIIRHINIISKTINVYDIKAPEICQYLKDNHIVACAENCVNNSKVYLIGQIKDRWNIILDLINQNKIVIDIIDIRAQLINRTLPIAMYSN